MQIAWMWKILINKQQEEKGTEKEETDLNLIDISS